MTSRANNSRILRIKNANFSEFYFYMNTNIKGDFQIQSRMSVKIMNIQPQTKTTGSYKTEVYDFCIIIVQSLCDTKIWVCFYQMHTQK